MAREEHEEWVLGSNCATSGPSFQLPSLLRCDQVSSYSYCHSHEPVTPNIVNNIINTAMTSQPQNCAPSPKELLAAISSQGNVQRSLTSFPFLLSLGPAGGVTLQVKLSILSGRVSDSPHGLPRHHANIVTSSWLYAEQLGCRQEDYQALIMNLL